MPRRRQPESPPCDPKPSAFDYINYCESGGASGTHATAIHNGVGGLAAGLRSASAPPRNVQKKNKKAKNIPETFLKVPAPSQQIHTPKPHPQIYPPPTSELRLTFTSCLVELHRQLSDKVFPQLVPTAPPSEPSSQV